MARRPATAPYTTSTSVPEVIADYVSQITNEGSNYGVGHFLRQPRFRGSAPINLGEAIEICEVRTIPQSPAAIASDGHCPKACHQRSARHCVEMLPQMLVISFQVA